ncbi:MAG TPA: TldD/PmbA family protein [Candidatus Polarisedimenticolia bacterium]|jgi:TldD protein|nr:TldD/PmbA family protein [Candidatus Polarisedimenticolia bacterium]
MRDPLASLVSDDLLAQAIGAVPARPGVEWAELFLERCETRRVEWGPSGGPRLVPGMREGFAVRRVGPAEQTHHSEEGLDPERILAACRRLEAGAPGVPAAGSRERRLAPDPAEGGALRERDGTALAATLETLARRLTGRLGPALSFELSLETRRRWIRVALAGAAPRSDVQERAVLTCRLALPGGGIVLGAGAVDLERLLARHPEEEIGREAGRSIEARDAREAPAGEATVVLAPGTGGVFFHEACGHALEADLVLNHASPFRNLLGEKVAADFVGAMDDSTQPGLEGGYACDDEGSPCRGTVLIARGRLKAFLADRITGARLGGGTTANGRRESFRDLPLPRMSNTFLMAGTDDPDAIVRETPRGLYVRRLSGGSVDAASGDFLFRAEGGSLIENGRLTAPLRPFTIAGNGVSALRGIDRVGGDLRFGTGAGSCGKEGQKIPVAVGQPTLRLRSLAVRPG